MDSHLGYKEEGSLTPFQYSVAGALSGFLTRGLAQPLDVIKIRYQLQIEPTFGKKKGLYYGTLQSISTIYKQEGVRALWKGHVPAQFLTVSYGAAQFCSYYYLTKTAHNLKLNHETMVLATCGALSAFISTVISFPCDIARTRIVAQKIKDYTGMTNVWKRMYKNQGAASLWRGLLPTLGCQMPFTAIQFSIYKILFGIYPQFLENSAIVMKSTTCGVVAGTFAKFCIYPLDVLKKRMQILGSEQIRKELGQIVTYNNMFDVIKKICVKEGVYGWYKGMMPSLIKSGVYSGLIFSFYETICQGFSYWPS